MATTADKPMDLAQASQRIVWLDEERRRDHAELARLSQELASTLAVLKDQTIKQRETGDRLNSIESALAHVPELEDAITLTRSQLTPLREADIRLQDDVQQQAKDRQAQTDQATRVLADINNHVDQLAKSIDGMANRLHALETQRQELSDRVNDMPRHLQALTKSIDDLANRLQLVETQRKELSDRVNDIPGRLDAITKGADSLANRLQVVETQQKNLGTRMNELLPQLDVLGKTADGLTGRIKLLDTQQRDLFNRMNEVPVRLDTLIRADDALASRIQLVETQHKALNGRVNEIPPRLEDMAKTGKDLATRIQLLETRDQDHAAHEAAAQTQIARLEAAQAHVLEEAKLSMTRAEGLIPEIQKIGKDLALAQGENAKQHSQHVSSLTEQKELIGAVQRRAEEAIGSIQATKSQMDRLAENTFLIAEAANRLTALEEHLTVVESAYKGYQEVQDTRWGVEIPEMRNMIEEADNTTQANAAIVQELVANNQVLKEDMRALRVGLTEEHMFSEDLATALRGLIEEDVQNRLVMAQKQLQNIRRLANAPVESNPRDD